jgi:dGTP triphosphohydrolase
MSPEVEKVKSLQWAIEELSKQKEDLGGKLKIALKREETGSLIDEVNAQKDALDQRISALEDGLKISSELVDTPVHTLEKDISAVNEKLEIAQERLANLEQEQYLEELGRKLNRSHGEEFMEDEVLSAEPLYKEELPNALDSLQTSSNENVSKEISTTTQTMTTPTSRIEIEEETTASRIPDEEANTIQQSTGKKSTTPVPVEGLEETALKLGVEPEFLVEKGTKALLRMIARNGGQLKFPLEIDQID